jgi:hypothetical protein
MIELLSTRRCINHLSNERVGMLEDLSKNFYELCSILVKLGLTLMIYLIRKRLQH